MVSTLHDVARIAGVSIKTVSNVVNDYPHVSAATRDRVLSAIAELDYRPNLSARGLRSGKTGVIGLAIPELRQIYFAELADSIIRAAARYKLDVVIDQTSSIRESEVAVLSGTRLRLTDGIIFSPERLGQEDIEPARGRLPARPARRADVRRSDRSRHHAQRGVGSCRYRAPHRNRSATHRGDRRPPDRSGRHQFGEPAHPGLSRSARGGRPAATTPRLIRAAMPWHSENGAAAMRAMLDEGVSFDAVFTLTDTLGLGVLRALGEAGVRVPEDVAVLGFDNIDEAQVLGPVAVERRTRSRRDRAGRRGHARRAHQREGRPDAAAPDPRGLSHRRSRIDGLHRARRSRPRRSARCRSSGCSETGLLAESSASSPSSPADLLPVIRGWR